VRSVDDDGAVSFGCQERIAHEPSIRRCCVTARRILHVWTGRLDGGQALSNGGSISDAVAAHDKRSAQTMGEDAVRVLAQYPLHLRGGVPAMREQEFECAFASLQRSSIGFHAERLGSIKPHRFFHGCLLRRTCESGESIRQRKTCT
jgi:hypothetical protein